LLGFEEYYNELKTKLERNREQVKKSFAIKMSEASRQKKSILTNSSSSSSSSTQAGLEKKLLEQLESLQKTFDTSVGLLVAAYESHMTNLAPINPWNLPVSVTLILPERNIVLENVILQPSETIKELRVTLKKILSTEKGNVIKEFTKDNVFALQR
jgi:hypothetical protein